MIPVVLLCTAWKLRGSAGTFKLGPTIPRSKGDEVFPIEDGRERARQRPSRILADLVCNVRRRADAIGAATTAAPISRIELGRLVARAAR